MNGKFLANLSMPVKIVLTILLGASLLSVGMLAPWPKPPGTRSSSPP